MCFSATASFASCAILGVAGIASLKNTKEPKRKLFAAVPLLFSIQQLSEGFVWLSFSGIEPPEWRHTAMTFFLIFALIIWPIWVPLCSILIEENKKRKALQYVCLIAGSTFGLFSMYYMFNYEMFASIRNYHVYYQIEFPNKNNPLTEIFYFMATVAPLLFSSVRRVPVLGALIFASFLVTKLYYDDYIISVWCFFAALISGIVYLMVTNRITSFQEKGIESSPN